MAGEHTKQTQSEIESNLRKVESGKPDFPAVFIAPDPSNPNITKTEEASSKEGLPAVHTQKPVLDRASFNQIALTRATEMGTLLDQTHLDEMWTLCHSQTRYLSQFEMTCYLSALRLANQLSPMQRASELITSLTAALKAVSNDAAKDREVIKQLTDRVTNLTTQNARDTAALANTVASTIESGVAKVLDKIAPLEGKMKNPVVSQPPATFTPHAPYTAPSTLTGASNALTPSASGSQFSGSATASKPMISSVLNYWKVPIDISSPVIEKYGGVMLMSDYELLKHAMDKQTFLTILRGFKGKYS